MSIKSIIQFFIIILIFLIIGGVYKKYFDTKQNIVEEINIKESDNSEQIKELEFKITELEKKNEILNKKIENNNINSKVIDSDENENKNVSETNKEINETTKKSKVEKVEKKIINVSKDPKDKKTKEQNLTKKELKNVVKDVEYISVDQKGNKFYLLASSGKSNEKNNDILDLTNVRGKITSDTRDTIYIVSDFAQYNSLNLNSKFYENVIIDYQDKKITCVNFDINMETNKAIAYNNVIITDPKSIMKAGIVEFDLKTKDININPQNTMTDVEVITN